MVLVIEEAQTSITSPFFSSFVSLCLAVCVTYNRNVGPSRSMLHQRLGPHNWRGGPDIIRMGHFSLEGGPHTSRAISSSFFSTLSGKTSPPDYRFLHFFFTPHPIRSLPGGGGGTRETRGDGFSQGEVGWWKNRQKNVRWDGRKKYLYTCVPWETRFFKSFFGFFLFGGCLWGHWDAPVYHNNSGLFENSLGIVLHALLTVLRRKMRGK